VERVWKYVNRFSDWIPYQHRVKANVEDIQGKFKIVPVPPNQV
jgi:UDP-galactopyranose mutase